MKLILLEASEVCEFENLLLKLQVSRHSFIAEIWYRQLTRIIGQL